jgi:hypothetical protein
MAEARQTVSRQSKEIDRLRRQPANNPFAEQLREALRLAATAGRIAAPVTHAIFSI